MMIKATVSISVSTAVLSGILLTACSKLGPELTVSDLVALEPLAGSDATVAYMTLHNHGEVPLTVNRVSSKDFGIVEIHETITEGEMVRMRRLESVTLQPETSTRFEPGGKHLMLMEPTADLVAGSPVTLQIEYDEYGMIFVSTELKPRM